MNNSSISATLHRSAEIAPVCPMKINLHNLLVFNRRDAVKEGDYKSSKNLMEYVETFQRFRRNLMDMAGSK
jgi:L-lactate dehydrogenase complex protein LldF